MDIFSLVKLGAGIMIPTGVGAIAKAFTSPKIANMRTFEKICAVAATSAVSAYIADKAIGHFSEEVDRTQLALVQAKLIRPLETKEERRIIIVQEDDENAED